jgi:hypothetical protein
MKRKMKKLKGQEIRRFPETLLWNCKGHKGRNGGCYLRLDDSEYSHSAECESKEIGLVIIDFNTQNQIKGIEFCDGLPNWKNQKKKRKKK